MKSPNHSHVLVGINGSAIVYKWSLKTHSSHPVELFSTRGCGNELLSIVIRRLKMIMKKVEPLRMLGNNGAMSAGVFPLSAHSVIEDDVPLTEPITALLGTIEPLCKTKLI